MSNIIRHGDVFLRCIGDARPEGCKPKKIGRIVVAEGEASGHEHIVLEAEQYVGYKIGNLIFVESPTEIVHEKYGQPTLEHNTLAVNPGLWEVVHQNEYDYHTQRMRSVAD